MKFQVLIWILIKAGIIMSSQRCPKECNCIVPIMECQREFPTSIPENVTEVILYGLNIDKTLDFSEGGWLKVTKLSINPGESFSNTRGNISGELNSRMFERLKNLEELQVACRCLRHIRQDAFYGLDKLRKLDLSNNHLTRESFINGIKGDTILPGLEELVYSSTSVIDFGILLIKASATLIIEEEFLDAVRNKPLKVLDLSQTKVLFPSEQTFFQAFPHLETLNISDSGLAVPSLLLALSESTLIFPGFRNLTSIDISVPPDQDKIVLPGGGDYYTHFSSLLKELYLYKSLTQPFEILYGVQKSYQGYKQKETACVTLRFADSSSSYCILGKLNVEKLVVSENSICAIDLNIYKHVTKLRYVDLSKNSLGHEFGKEDYMKSAIKTLNRLEVLIISDNGIHTIPDNAFENAEMLKMLDLSHNSLESLTFRTDKLTALQHLDLRHNRIYIVDRLSLQNLITLKGQVISKTPTENGSTNIYLEGNLITCSCDNRHYFNWTLCYNESSSCLLDGVRKDIDYTVLSHSYYLCKETIVIVVYTSLAIIELVVIIILVWFYLRERKDAKLRQKIKQGIQKYNGIRENVHRKPVFLSFCCEDDETVMGEIVPKLEEGLKRLLKTDSRCVASGYNDFRPGMSLANEIIRCIEESSVVIFFVTNAFCRKMWCRNESLIAYYENKPTILMIWEKLDLRLMPKYLYHHYQHNARVHWVTENGQRVMKPDWDNLCESVVSLFVN